MRVGYGYDVHPDEFAALGCEKVWIDMPGTGRQERGDMLDEGGLREGDTLVVFDLAHLGRKAKAAVEARGIEIEVAERRGEKKPPGAPAKFTPNAEQDAKIRTLWLNPGYTLAYVMDRAADIMGGPVARHQLVYRYGNRHKRSTEQS